MKQRKLQLAALILLSLLAAPQWLLAQIAVGDKFKEGGLYYRVTRTSPPEVAIVPEKEKAPYWNLSEEPKGWVSIPAEVQLGDTKYSVTSIGKNALSGCTHLTEVSIPSSVTSIAGGAFSGCSELNSVISHITDVSAVSMGENVFEKVNVATCKLIVPDGKVDDYRAAAQWKEFRSVRAISSFGQVVGDKFKVGGLYYKVTSTSPLEVAVVPEIRDFLYLNSSEAPKGWVSIPAEVQHGDTKYSVTSIDDYAFSGCKDLTEVSIPSSVTSIADGAFSGCRRLYTVISYITDVSAVEMGGYVFRSVPVSTCELFVPDGKEDDYRAAAQWKEFTRIRAISSLGQVVGDKFKVGSLYYKVTSTSPLEVAVVPPIEYTDPRWNPGEEPKGWVSIPAEVQLGDTKYSVTGIGYYAFSGCKDLTEVSIPSSVTSIRSGAFSGCTSLHTIISYIPDVSAVEMGGYVFRRVPVSTCKLFVPDGKEDDYRAAAQWKEFTNIRAISSLGQGVGDKFKVGGLYYKVTSTSPLEVAVAPQNNDYPRWEADKKPKGAINIPATVEYVTKTYTVTGIGYYAFSGCEDLTEVSIPSSVTSIAENAFSGCTNLTEVSIPSSVTSIADGAFFSCQGLRNIQVAPDNLNYSAQDGVLFNKGKNVLIFMCPDGRGGEYSIPSSVTRIAENAFYGCTNLTEVSIPSSVASIADGAFSACSRLHTVISYIPDVSAVRMGWDVFRSVPVYTCKLFVPDGKVDDYRAAAQWKEFTRIRAISSLGQVEGDKFKVGSLYYKVTSTSPLEVAVVPPIEYTDPRWNPGEEPKGWVSIPAEVQLRGTKFSVTSIGRDAFSNCRGLTAVTIPSSVTSIRSDAFSGCTSLHTIISYIPDVSAVWMIWDVFRNVPVSTCKLFVPDGKEDDYRAAAQWKEFTNIRAISSFGQVEGDKFKVGGLYYRVTSTSPFEVAVVPEFGDSPYWNRSEAPKFRVSIPAEVQLGDTKYSVTSIAENAFSGCTNLTEVSIPSSVTSIADGAFCACDNLNTVVSHITDVSAVTMGENVFEKVNVATCKLFVPDGKVDDYRAASQWKEFTNIRAISSLGQGVGDKFKVGSLYYQVTSTSPFEVAIVPEFGDSPYWNRSEAPKFRLSIPAEVQLGDTKYSVTSIAENAFCGCTDLTAVTIPSSVTKIENKTFNGCDNLTTINVAADNPNYSAHEGVLLDKNRTTLIQCPGGKNGDYTIPNSVTSIGELAFSGCTALTAVTIPSSVTSIADEAFKECNKLDTVFSHITDVSAVRMGWGVFSGVPVSTCKLFVPDGKVDDYRAAAQWNNFRKIRAISSLGRVVGDKFKVGRLYYRVTSTSPFEVAVVPQNEYIYPRWSPGEEPRGRVSIPSEVQLRGTKFSVTSIGREAFSNCRGLTAVSIPSSVTSIGCEAFSGCSELNSVISHITNVRAVWMEGAVFSGVPVSTCELRVPYGTVNAYKAAYQWKAFINIIAMDPSTAVAPAPEPLRLHPNPTAAGINLEAMGEVRVYNSLGHLALVVKANGPTRIDLSHLPAGIYIVRTGSRAAKVVKI